MTTTTIPTDIARFLADRARHDLEYAAEQHADCVTKAHELRKGGDKEQTPEAAAVYYAQAERMDRKADNWNDEFKQLEDICKALTKALTAQEESKRDAAFDRSTPSSRRKNTLRAI